MFSNADQSLCMAPQITADQIVTEIVKVSDLRVPQTHLRSLTYKQFVGSKLICGKQVSK